LEERGSGAARRGGARLGSALAGVALTLACGPAGAPEPRALPAQASAAASSPSSGRARVAIAGRLFELELALDDATRVRGLGGRRSVSEQGGMLFLWRHPRALGMVMRDCGIPLDVAFLDAAGRVLALHAMRPEPPRRLGESGATYEARLPAYPSPEPTQIAVELAGGRLAQLGVGPGDLVVIEHLEALLARAR
jgi:hypothetical protein